MYNNTFSATAVLLLEDPKYKVPFEVEKFKVVKMHRRNYDRLAVMFEILLTLSCLLGTYCGLEEKNHNEESGNTKWIVQRVNEFLTDLEPKQIRHEML